MPALDSKLEHKLEALERQGDELSHQLADPEIAGDMEQYRTKSQAYSELQPLIERWRDYRRASQELADARELQRDADDPEMKAMAAEEASELAARVETLGEQLRLLLLPSDPNDGKNVVLEVRAGTGGDEATLFAAEIFRMYQRFAERRRWKVNVTDISESAVGGVKEIIATIEGDRVYSALKFESGVHRVQRVPETEAQGRIHTSAVTVAVMPEAEEVDIEIDEKELRIDSFCSQGAGGQHVNRTQSAVRIVHLPTNTVVQCQDEKSWHKNKSRAMKVLRARLYDMELQKQQSAIAADRKSQVGSGDRSEKIRTYNFPQSRITDHRIGLTVHNLSQVLDGELGELVDALVAQDQAERLRAELDA